MLERATACLESGGRHLLRDSTRSFRGRRMLHSSFWHHGAIDLDLPAWWSTVLQPTTAPDREANARAADGRNGGSMHGSGHDGLFLDFLYPAKTLALMRRITTYGWDNLNSPRARLPRGERVRQFSFKASGRGNEDSAASEVDTALRDDQLADSASNKQWRPSSADLGGEAYDPFDEDDLAGFEGDSESIEDVSSISTIHRSPSEEAFLAAEKDVDVEETVINPDALESLRALLHSGESDHRAVWKLYRQLGESAHTADISADILDFLGTIRPFQPVHAERALEIFENLPLDQRRTSSYKCAIMSHLALGRLGRAALIHEHAIVVKKLDLGDFGTSALVAYAIKREEWQLAIEVYRAATNATGVSLRYWSGAKKQLDLLQCISPLLLFLKRLRRHSRLPHDKKSDISLFVTDFAEQTIQQATTHISAPVEQLQLWRLILSLNYEGLLQSRHYECALQGLIGAGKLPQSDEVPELIRRLYKLYIERARTGFTKPHPGTLYAMVRTLTSHPRPSRGTRLRVTRVIGDWRYFYGRPSTKALKLLMVFYARLGDVHRVELYFKDLLAITKRHVEDVKVLRPLLQVHAQRGDINRTSEQFDRISQEFGLKPDVAAWNVLLHAYVRQDDLEGASKRFDEMLMFNVKPDAYSFSAILNLMARRGDVEGVRDMLSLASDIDGNIVRSAEVVGYLVSAHVNNEDVRLAELTAEQLWQRKESGLLEGSLTPIWNIIVLAHALRRDVAASRRVFKYMEEHGIKPDAFTYAALMQGLTLIHQTNAAYKILRLVVPQKRVKRLGLHYAIIMAGFINQREYKKALFVDVHRRSQAVHPTISTRIAMIKASTMAEMRDQAAEGIDRTALLERTEHKAMLMLQDNNPWELASEPQTGLGVTPLHQADETYLAFLIMAYGSRGSYDYARRMFDEYMERVKIRRGDPDIQPPLRMLTALMHVHLRGGRYEEVEECWNLALSQAQRLTSLYTPLTARDTIEDNLKSTDVTVLGVREGGIAYSRRHILSRPLAIYMWALNAQGRYTDVMATVTTLMNKGFTLDNHALNMYVQILARNGRIGLAYATCEELLMPYWRGWRQTYLPYRHYTRTRGWEYMKASPNLAPRGTIGPAYRTLVILAAGLKWVRRVDATGTSNVRGVKGNEAEALSEELLKARAPKTIAAVETMPYVEDEVQGQFLRND